jgi:diketogulonate reductase-like aldo/keto reductase
MEKLPATKLTRFIGFSNFNPSQVADILRIATIKPKVVQIELHPYLAQTEFLHSLQAQNITVNAYAPLANTSPHYTQKTTKILQHSTITSIASARGCTPAQVVLGWNMRRGVAVIPKAVVSAHWKENLETQKRCKLTAADDEKITAISQTKQYRFNTQPCAANGGRCWTGLAKG